MGGCFDAVRGGGLLRRSEAPSGRTRRKAPKGAREVSSWGLQRYAFTICVAALLEGCGGSPLIGAPGAMPQTALDASMMRLAIPTCAKSPPQYQWIFRGACDRHVTLHSRGGFFGLAGYDSITVIGAIGRNTAKTTATLTIADATDTYDDVVKWEGKAFPKFIGRGKTVFYAVAINQSGQVIKFVTMKGTSALLFTVIDAEGLPGKTCGFAILTFPGGHNPTWKVAPAVGKVRNGTVTISQYVVPEGMELLPKTPLYFAVSCWR
jgi:hypothetical protein